ncbi:IS5/IS1182 family transposase, partial [Neisseria gonorrhoeae]
AQAPGGSVPYHLYCLRLRRLVLIFVNPLYHFG